MAISSSDRALLAVKVTDETNHVTPWNGSLRLFPVFIEILEGRAPVDISGYDSRPLVPSAVAGDKRAEPLWED